jgi:hypothetical protein
MCWRSTIPEPWLNFQQSLAAEGLVVAAKRAACVSRGLHPACPGPACLQGDYHRYLAEFKTGLERKEAAEHTLLAYKAAQVSSNRVEFTAGVAAAMPTLCPCLRCAVQLLICMAGAYMKIGVEHYLPV